MYVVIKVQSSDGDERYNHWWWNRNQPGTNSRYTTPCLLPSSPSDMLQACQTDWRQAMFTSLHHHKFIFIFS